MIRGDSRKCRKRLCFAICLARASLWSWCVVGVYHCSHFSPSHSRMTHWRLADTAMKRLPCYLSRAWSRSDPVTAIQILLIPGVPSFSSHNGH
ncbi:hypothetical protein BGY98DRAFT_259246 [Russula aff. rugulosa BPL654]|nr:hypothetical protein BGY98DRAFT_259246 [Russula aff. rugulosa BPL654]